MCICLKVCLSVNRVEYTFPNPTKEGAPCGSRPTRDRGKCVGVLHESSGNDPNTHTPVVGKDNRLLEALQHLDCVPARGSSDSRVQLENLEVCRILVGCHRLLVLLSDLRKRLRYTVYKDERITLSVTHAESLLLHGNMFLYLR